MKTTVIHHSADYDGLFCREIARKFLPGAELIGWDFPDKPLPIPEGQIYILDLPVDRVFGFNFQHCEQHLMNPPVALVRIVWIDHHRSSIETHPTSIPGYRIDGVAACRLAWQWFNEPHINGTVQAVTKDDFLNRKVDEPLAVRLAGEYDVWDHKPSNREDIVFQFGLRSRVVSTADWDLMLQGSEETVHEFIEAGRPLYDYQRLADESLMKHKSFMVEFEGLKFLAINTPRCNSLTFTSKDVPETGHDAIMAFYHDGRDWHFSLYHAEHRKDIDLSVIARRLGGGGHKGACGFKSPFPPHAWRVL